VNTHNYGQLTKFGGGKQPGNKRIHKQGDELRKAIAANQVRRIFYQLIIFKSAEQGISGYFRKVIKVNERLNTSLNIATLFIFVFNTVNCWLNAWICP